MKATMRTEAVTNSVLFLWFSQKKKIKKKKRNELIGCGRSQTENHWAGQRKWSFSIVAASYRLGESKGWPTLVGQWRLDDSVLGPMDLTDGPYSSPWEETFSGFFTKFCSLFIFSKKSVPFPASAAIIFEVVILINKKFKKLLNLLF